MNSLLNIKTFAAAALCINESDYGTERQIDAENGFFDAVREDVPADDFEALEDYCHKATTDEQVVEGFRCWLRAEAASPGSFLVETARNNDLDAGVARIMGDIGTRTGDVAAQAFADIDWSAANQSERVAALIAWLVLELLDAERVAS